MNAKDLEGRLFITVGEFAAMTSSDPRTVRRGIEAGDIPAVRFSGTTRIPVPQILALLGLDQPSSAHDHEVSTHPDSEDPRAARPRPAVQPSQRGDHIETDDPAP